MKVPNPFEHYPPLWTDFDARAQSAHRVFTSAANVNRFAARYRLAKAFRGLRLDGYSEATARGYDSLTRLTLAWSSFEGLLVALGRTRHDIPSLSAEWNLSGCIEGMRSADPQGKFMAFVMERLDSARQKAEVEKFLKGTACCALTMAQGVRHIFVHGPLTPSANQAEPSAVVSVCDRLAVMLTTVMDREFSDQVKKLVVLVPTTKDDDAIPF